MRSSELLPMRLDCLFGGLLACAAAAAAKAAFSGIPSLTNPYDTDLANHGRWHGLCLFPEERPDAGAGIPELNPSRWSLPC